MKKGRTGTLDKIIGRNLQELRALRQLTQQQVAQALGITFQQIQKYESGVNRVSAARLYELHLYFNVPLERFFIPPRQKVTNH